ncbi:hypothetical protein FF011L_49140 [Roseimaritima multifibrata]|uniref:Chain length determinant protein n=1 Tax=Roseimaritima multifibrata TaxID=1930274 RepID=A0A517MMV2_9BACT|nr:hypothetical protein [Roseimaritima multifibrata]QDS96107.1 hypothetical protein FF011L_49140 [Roseimaritima multifibrata]
MNAMDSTPDSDQLFLANPHSPSAVQNVAEDSEQSSEAAKHLIGSLKRRWWYYLLITAIAGGAGYFVAKEYGSYVYTAYTQVRAQTLPFPPGKAYYVPPAIEDFAGYLSHPQVVAALQEDYGIVPDPTGKEQLVEHKYDRSTKVITVQMSRAAAAEAAAVANQVVQDAIALSLSERKQSLADSLRYFSSLVGEAEAEAASKRQAKADRLSALKTRFAKDRGAELAYEEVTELVSRKREHVAKLEDELEDAQRLRDVLSKDQQELLAKAAEEPLETVREELTTRKSEYADKSAQAREIDALLARLDKLQGKEITSSEELYATLGELSKIAGREVSISERDIEQATRIDDDMYKLRNQLILLPRKLEAERQDLSSAIDQRAGMAIADEMDFENTPEILELTAQIERAERSVEEITNAVSWVTDMQALETPVYEQLVVASPETAIPDGNQKKLFVLVFGGIGVVLGMPLLMFDIIRPPSTPSQRLSKQFGISMLATHELIGKSIPNRQLEANDPELRLLALRIQQAARTSRGSVVLFSSLADHVGTADLTTTVAKCLAAREERVLVINLEPIAENRKGLLASPRGRHEINSVPHLVASPVNGNQRPELDSDQLGVPAEVVTEDGEILSVSEESADGGRFGLAMALAGATKSPDDVLVFHGEDGIDRLELGEGELPVEAFASPLMTKLLDKYRNEYSMVLLSGPAAKHVADVQMLASRCDGTLFVAPKRGSLTPRAHRIIEDLVASRNPIMGIAEIPT